MSVCNNQQDFESALKSASRYVRDEEKPPSNTMKVVCIVYLIIGVWALLLALRVPSGTKRIEHIVFALIFPPAYIVAHYLGNN